MEVSDEAEIVAAFVAWLVAKGWTVQTEVAWADIVAERDGERLIAEAKGGTSEPGLDLDTLYGQLLRRMVPDENVRYGVVVPARVEPTALRVPSFVRRALAIDVYSVAMMAPSTSNDSGEALPGGGLDDRRGATTCM
jgi:hypothetical protein